MPALFSGFYCMCKYKQHGKVYICSVADPHYNLSDIDNRDTAIKTYFAQRRAAPSVSFDLKNAKILLAFVLHHFWSVLILYFRVWVWVTHHSTWLAITFLHVMPELGSSCCLLPFKKQPQNIQHWWWFPVWELLPKGFAYAAVYIVPLEKCLIFSLKGKQKIDGNVFLYLICLLRPMND